MLRREIEKNLEVLFEELSKTAPLAPNYQLLLGHIRELMGIRERYIYFEEDRAYYSEVCEPLKEEPSAAADAESAPETVTAEPKAKTKSKAKAKITSEPDTTGPTPVAEPVDGGELTKEYVRGLLKQKAAEGIPIKPIMQKYIPEGKNVTFSSIKQEDYPAFVKELTDAR